MPCQDMPLFQVGPILTSQTWDWSRPTFLNIPASWGRVRGTLSSKGMKEHRDSYMHVFSPVCIRSGFTSILVLPPSGLAAHLEGRGRLSFLLNLS